MKKYILPFCFLLFLTNCNDGKPNEKDKTPKTEKVSKTAPQTKIILNSNDTMKFDKNMILVPAGKTITLTLNHTGKFGKRGMGHNFVLLKSDVDVNDFATRAASAMKTEYIPEGDEIIAYTKLLGGGDTDTITFDAPKKGIYTFICTFPGHWQLMKGKFIVK